MGAVPGFLGALSAVLGMYLAASVVGRVGSSEGRLVAGGAVGVFALVTILVGGGLATAVGATGGYIGASMAED